MSNLIAVCSSAFLVGAFALVPAANAALPTRPVLDVGHRVRRVDDGRPHTHTPASTLRLTGLKRRPTKFGIRLPVGQLHATKSADVAAPRFKIVTLAEVTPRGQDAG
jgi:hypothetical protein